MIPMSPEKTPTKYAGRRTKRHSGYDTTSKILKANATASLVNITCLQCRILLLLEGAVASLFYFVSALLRTLLWTGKGISTLTMLPMAVQPSEKPVTDHELYWQLYWGGLGAKTKVQPTATVCAEPNLESSTGSAESHFVDDDDPIVIVGIACRLPGGVSSPQDLWEALLHGRSGQCVVPKARFNIDGFLHPESHRAGVLNTDGGYFVQEDVRQFENGFFGINNVEATYMDPQQRKLLEVVYECFENSGTSLDAVAGTNVGVYVGNFTVDYQTMQARDADYLHRYSATGSGTAILANRISHIFDLRGPSFTLDTACSSSIYCLHNAVVALENYDCDAAIVAGANLITSPEQQLGTMKGGVLSPTSTCRTFDASADGYGRGEGISALYIKRASTALRNGDHLYAVIRATALNSNGKTPWISQPSITGQVEVIRKAYNKAELDPKDTSYVECHGTGTALGDPTEVEALSKVFLKRAACNLMIGSVKPNLGHSEAASGISSIIKVALAFEHGSIPPTIGITQLNPKIPFDLYNFKVVTETSPWPSPLRRASINSFGYGGANAHVILESARGLLSQFPRDRKRTSSNQKRQNFLIPLSASSSSSLNSSVLQLSDRIKKGQQYDLRDLSYTLSTRRSMLKMKGFIITNQTALQTDFIIENLVSRSTDNARLPICLIFTGQGSQWPRMGSELMDSYPEYMRTIKYLDEKLQSLPEAPSWKLKEVILGPKSSSKIDEVIYSQPLCTAVQIGLVDVMKTWGIDYTTVVGHSSGEIAAAYAAGLIDATEAITIAYYRGFVVSKAESAGAMLAASLSATAASKIIEEASLQAEVNVACINSPESVTLSGTCSAIEKLSAALEKLKVFNRRLRTGGKAYHSPMMREVSQEYENLLKLRLPCTSTTRYANRRGATMFSSVESEGRALPCFSSTSPLVGATYWRRNLESPVQFLGAMTNATRSGSLHIIEIGPHSALQLPTKQIRMALGLREEELPYNSTLLRGKDADICLKTLAGQLFLRGHSLNFLEINVTEKGKLLHDLPPYPWTYNHLLWSEPRSSVEYRNRQYLRHELLGSETFPRSGIDRNWNNKLRLNEIPWLKDHRLGGAIVFPAAGYLTMVIEAMTQSKGLKIDEGRLPTFTFRNVSFQSMLILRHDDAEPELFTNLRAEHLSATKDSELWHNFSVTSWKDGTATQHCRGSLSIAIPPQKGDVGVRADLKHTEQWSMQRWYEKLAIEGLSFGPTFQTLTSMKTDASRLTTQTLSETLLLQRVKRSEDAPYEGFLYPVYPLVIDSFLQASIMGSTAGSIDALQAHVPVFIDYCQVTPPSRDQVGLKASICSEAFCTGFGSKRVDATLRDSSGRVVIHMVQARLSAFEGDRAREDQDLNDRQPFLRVIWKPDVMAITNFSKHAIQDFLHQNVNNDFSDPADEKTRVIAGLLDLIGHKNPRLCVLQLSKDDHNTRRSWLNVLDFGTPLSRCRDWHVGSFEGNQLFVAGCQASGNLRHPFRNTKTVGKYGLILLDQEAMDDCRANLDSLLKCLQPQGFILVPNCKAFKDSMKDKDLMVVQLQHDLLMARIPRVNQPLKSRDIVFLEHSGQPSSSFQEWKNRLSSITGAQNITSYGFEDASDLPRRPFVISLLELQNHLLPNMGLEEFQKLKSVINEATDLIWLTGAGMMEGRDPNLGLSSGPARALALEQPSLRFITLDIGSLMREASPENQDFLYSYLEELVCQTEVNDDREFVAHNGAIHISRFIPDKTLNDAFSPGKTTEMTLEGAAPARLAISKVGLMDSIYFQQEIVSDVTPPDGFVDVDVKAVSLNAKDIYALSGKVETWNGTSAIESSGIIKATGSAIAGLETGDHVVVLAPNLFRTTERVPAWACQKMLPHEKFEIMATLPVIYGTALYALDDRAALRSKETILIHSGAGAFGMAAISVALRMGAIVYTTVSTEEKANFLIQEYGLSKDHIFQSRDPSFVAGIRAATKGKGVDVILNSLTGDLLHASWSCIANFGRIVEIGKRDIVDAGKIGMDAFGRNATFTAFDLTELYYHENQYYRDIWINKFKDVLRMYRAGEIKPVPIKVFELSDITHAYRYFSRQDRIGKVVISLQNPKSIIRTAPKAYSTKLDPRKSYLLVGCLGGLGRSLSKWMLHRGARKFTFLGRSGCDRPTASILVQELRSLGATVRVIRGDVVNERDVAEAVNACEQPIGGIIQAAMGLSEALFSQMRLEAWHTVIQPKWRGTWNLHNALEGRDNALDFFLLTSSVSGSVGTATESNYCAANAFLDAFARYLRMRGKPGCSLGLGMISEVGYLHENPHIEALLLRKGIKPLNEEEFLRAVDLALADIRRDNSVLYDKLAAAHILTGLESHGLRELMRKGFDVDTGTMQDPRAVLLAASLDQEKVGAATSSVAYATWMSGLSQTLVESLSTESAAPTLRAAILHLIRKRFSNLILIQIDELDDRKPLLQYGIDSMIAAEYRSWLWSTFHVDKTFSEILSLSQSLSSLADLMIAKLDRSQ